MKRLVKKAFFDIMTEPPSIGEDCVIQNDANYKNKSGYDLFYPDKVRDGAVLVLDGDIVEIGYDHESIIQKLKDNDQYDETRENEYKVSIGYYINNFLGHFSLFISDIDVNYNLGVEGMSKKYNDAVIYKVLEDRGCILERVK